MPLANVASELRTRRRPDRRRDHQHGRSVCRDGAARRLPASDGRSAGQLRRRVAGRSVCRVCRSPCRPRVGPGASVGASIFRLRHGDERRFLRPTGIECATRRGHTAAAHRRFMYSAIRWCACSAHRLRVWTPARVSALPVRQDYAFERSPRRVRYYLLARDCHRIR